jgi:HNH endonuclease
VAQFPEAVRLEVRRRSAFRCCRCQNIGIEAHHIVPPADGGDDSFDNAAPLCPNCHAVIGGNREKRREIRQMRDWWYELVPTIFAPIARQTAEALSASFAEAALGAGQSIFAQSNAVLRQIFHGELNSSEIGTCQYEGAVNWLGEELSEEAPPVLGHLRLSFDDGLLDLVATADSIRIPARYTAESHAHVTFMAATGSGRYAGAMGFTRLHLRSQGVLGVTHAELEDEAELSLLELRTP